MTIHFGDYSAALCGIEIMPKGSGVCRPDPRSDNDLITCETCKLLLAVWRANAPVGYNSTEVMRSFTLRILKEQGRQAP